MTGRRILSLFLLALCFAVPRGGALAYSEGLVALQFAEGGLYTRAVRIEMLLKEGFGFNRVRVIINADADGLVAHVRRFASQQAVRGERRFIWVSGVTARRPGDPCPVDTAGAVRPRTALLMIAPPCFRRLIDAPPGIRHAASAPDWIDPDRPPLPVIAPLSPDTFAFVSLPDDRPEVVEAADGVILDRLSAGRGGAMSAYVLFATLRGRLSVDGSDFTPSLESSTPKAAWATNIFGGVTPTPAGPSMRLPGQAPFAGVERTIRRDLRLHPAPDLAGLSVAIAAPGAPVRVLRGDSSGTMAFIETKRGRFGWVDRTALK